MRKLQREEKFAEAKDMLLEKAFEMQLDATEHALVKVLSAVLSDDDAIQISVLVQGIIEDWEQLQTCCKQSLLSKMLMSQGTGFGWKTS